MATPSSSVAGPATRSKRRRIEHSLVRDTDLWMGDGNIIVAAVEETEEDKVTYAFRVHLSVLSKHSPIFEDLLTLPQAANSETYEGLPVVTLPDPYHDVKGLLQMIYDPSELCDFVALDTG